jgi:hypothetical protein
MDRWEGVRSHNMKLKWCRAGSYAATRWDISLLAFMWRTSSPSIPAGLRWVPPKFVSVYDQLCANLTMIYYIMYCRNGANLKSILFYVLFLHGERCTQKSWHEELAAIHVLVASIFVCFYFASEGNCSKLFNVWYFGDNSVHIFLDLVVCIHQNRASQKWETKVILAYRVYRNLLLFIFL